VSVPDSLVSLLPAAPGETVIASADDAVRKNAVRTLTSLGLVAASCVSGSAALELVESKMSALDCVVLDTAMADVWHTLAGVHTVARDAQIPIVLLTDPAPDEAHVLKMFELGATDVMDKPLSPALFGAKVRMLAERSRAQRELRQKLELARELATHDVLTGLFNRRYFERRMKEEIAHARRHKRAFSIVLLDLDHFKLVNDTYGHEHGDRVLCHVAKVLESQVRQDDVACRFGGEEFVLLLRDTPAMAARVVANRLRAALASKPLPLGPDGELRHVTFSAGVAGADERNGFAVDDVVARADAALYRAKDAGRNRVEGD
jgi:two-component system cell cycle response regulator